MPEQLQESKKPEEVFKPVEVVIIDPEGDKNFMVGFGNTLKTWKYTRDQLEVYSTVIPEILEESGLRPFHQVGSGEKDGPQLWEVWGETTREYLEKLILKIHQAAADYVDLMFGMRSDISELVS